MAISKDILDNWGYDDYLDFINNNLGYGTIYVLYNDVASTLYSDGENVWHKKQLDALLDLGNLSEECRWFAEVFVREKWFLKKEEDVKKLCADQLWWDWTINGIEPNFNVVVEKIEYAKKFKYHYSKVFGLPVVDKPLHLKCDYTPEQLQRLYSLCVSQSIIASTTTYETFAYRMAGVGTPTTQKIGWVMQGKRHKGCSKSGLLRFVEKHGKVRIGQDARSKRIITEVFGLPPISASTISRIDGEHNQLIDHMLD